MFPVPYHVPRSCNDTRGMHRGRRIPYHFPCCNILENGTTFEDGSVTRSLVVIAM